MFAPADKLIYIDKQEIISTNISAIYYLYSNEERALFNIRATFKA